MWKQKIGISVGSSAAEPVDLLADIGFEALSPAKAGRNDLTPLAEAAARRGMALHSLHAPFGRAAGMWNGDPAVYEPAMEDLFSALEDCRRFEIPILVVHTWIGFEYSDIPNEQGFRHFGEVAARAGQYGVKLAFENTEGEEFLFALMEHFREDDTVGFCWDSGHELCYNHSQDLLRQLGDRLLVTHLNDNLGISRFDGKTYWTDDLHLLPYDGIADWDNNIARLRASRKLDVLNFELSITSKPGRRDNDLYGQMPLERYYTEAYKRACRIAQRYIG